MLQVHSLAPGPISILYVMHINQRTSTWALAGFHRMETSWRSAVSPWVTPCSAMSCKATACGFLRYALGTTTS